MNVCDNSPHWLVVWFGSRLLAAHGVLVLLHCSKQAWALHYALSCQKRCYSVLWVFTPAVGARLAAGCPIPLHLKQHAQQTRQRECDASHGQ